MSPNINESLETKQSVSLDMNTTRQKRNYDLNNIEIHHKIEKIDSHENNEDNNSDISNDESNNINNEYDYEDSSEIENKSKNNEIDEDLLQSDYSKLSPIPEENIDKYSLSQTDYFTPLSQQKLEFPRNSLSETPEIPYGDESCEIIQDYIVKIEEILENGNNLYEKVIEILNNSSIEIQSQKFR